MAKCEPLRTPLRGQNWKRDQTPLLGRTEEREISLTVLDPGDVSTLRLHRSSFSGITLSAMEGHTLILNAPWREHGLKRVCFRCHGCHNLAGPKYLTKLGNPKVASPKMRRSGADLEQCPKFSCRRLSTFLPATAGLRLSATHFHASKPRRVTLTGPRAAPRPAGWRFAIGGARTSPERPKPFLRLP
jgi:hypothetical protein